MFAANLESGNPASRAPAGQVTAWAVNTAPFPKAERHRVWSDAMRRICLPIGEIVEPDTFRGSIQCVTSPLGFEFALVEADALEISGGFPQQSPAIWLSLLLDGNAVATSGERRIDLAKGDILYGPTGVDASLRLMTPFRQLFIRVPAMTLSSRFVAPLAPEIGHIPGNAGISQVFTGMLRSLASVMKDVNAAELGAVEIALTEFFLSCLGKTRNSAMSHVGTEGARAACLHRICQTIEARLGDPDLNVSGLASEHGVSPRYLQKLFNLAGRTFSGYVRTRRLERCRMDLGSEQHDQLSISQICFRWGFNCSSHFSRAFREQYKTSPRQYRRSAALEHKGVTEQTNQDKRLCLS